LFCVFSRIEIRCRIFVNKINTSIGHSALNTETATAC